jgi:hypothetical protein
MLKATRAFRLCLLTLAGFAVACGGDGGGNKGGDSGSCLACDGFGGGGGASGDPGSSLTSTCLSSTTGSTSIAVGDTIQFEVTVTTIENQDYLAVIWSLSGDATQAVMSTVPDWPGVSHNVTNWAWNYMPGKGTVRIGTNGSITPFAPGLPTPDRVAGFYGFLVGINGSVSKTGDGVPALVGTVTITADTPGSFMGGGIQIPGFDGFLDPSAMDDPPTVNLGTFTVTP